MWVSSHPKAGVLWPAVKPSTSFLCSEARRDAAIYSGQFTSPECGHQGSVPCGDANALRFARFSLRSAPSNPATPECIGHFALNIPLLMFDVINSPSLLGHLVYIFLSSGPLFLLL